jgi:hypothetical protein
MEEHEEQERIRAKKERERMLEEQTLYVFDSGTKAEAVQFKKSRKLTDCEIDVKSFLLSERNEMKKKSLIADHSSQEEAFEKFRYEFL